MKIFKGYKILYYFLSKPFRFSTDKLRALFAELDAEEQSKFFFDHTKIDPEIYLYNAVRQIRRSLLQEDDATIPKAQEKLRRFYYAYISVQALSWSAILYYSARFATRLLDY